MQVLIQSKTLQVTEALRAFIQRQVGRVIKASPRVDAVTVFLEKVARKKNDAHAAIARIQIIRPGKDLIVERRSRDLYQAIQDMSLSAARAVGRAKEKRLTMKRTGRFGRPAFTMSTTL